VFFNTPSLAQVHFAFAHLDRTLNINPSTLKSLTMLFFSNDDDFELSVDTEAEPLSKYCDGGFCPIDLGDRIADRFTVLHKLGFGGFGTVWLVQDEEERHGRYVALKVVSARWSDKNGLPGVIDRLREFDNGRDKDSGFPSCFVLELEHFFQSSIHGRHLCQVFPVLGPSLSALADIDPPLLLYPRFVKGFSQQLCAAVDTLHALGICHGGTFSLAHE
jgi:serine/threonine protein kinase